MKQIKAFLALFKKKAVYYYRLSGLYFLKYFQKHIHLIIIIVATTLALFARYKMILYPTQDMVGYVLGWLNQIKANGFASFYTIDADYSPLFLFILALVSLLPSGELVSFNGHTFYGNDMIYVKSIYFAFTIALAFAVYLIVKQLTKDKTKATIGYILTIALPTVFLNSTIWGNADVIYATFVVYAFYWSLVKKDGLAFAFFGLAFSFKMQAVFLLPYLVLLLLNRQMKFHKTIYAVLAFFLSLMPAFLFGASLGQALNFIPEQLTGYRKLTLGCANFWQLVNFRGDIVNDNATWFGLLLVGVVFAIVYLKRMNLSQDGNRFRVFFLLTMATVFFLPYMHERYFYLIDVAVIIYALIDKKKIHFVPLMQISSIIAYYHYLSGYYFIDRWGEDSVHIAAFINLFLLISVFVEVLKLEPVDDILTNTKQIEQEIEKLKATK